MHIRETPIEFESLALKRLDKEVYCVVENQEMEFGRGDKLVKRVVPVVTAFSTIFSDAKENKNLYTARIMSLAGGIEEKEGEFDTLTLILKNEQEYFAPTCKIFAYTSLNKPNGDKIGFIEEGQEVIEPPRRAAERCLEEVTGLIPLNPNYIFPLLRDEKLCVGSTLIVPFIIPVGTTKVRLRKEIVGWRFLNNSELSKLLENEKFEESSRMVLEKIVANYPRAKQYIEYIAQNVFKIRKME